MTQPAREFSIASTGGWSCYSHLIRDNNAFRRVQQPLLTEEPRTQHHKVTQRPRVQLNLKSDQSLHIRYISQQLPLHGPDSSPRPDTGQRQRRSQTGTTFPDSGFSSAGTRICTQDTKLVPTAQSHTPTPRGCAWKDEPQNLPNFKLQPQASCSGSAAGTGALSVTCVLLSSSGSQGETSALGAARKSLCNDRNRLRLKQV